MSNNNTDKMPSASHLASSAGIDYHGRALAVLKVPFQVNQRMEILRSCPSENYWAIKIKSGIIKYE